MYYFSLLTHFLFTLVLWYYFATGLQWYSYRLKRFFFHFTKLRWHLLYFFLPLGTYFAATEYFWIYFYFGLLPALYFWDKRLDKKLVFTGRIKRFFYLTLSLLIIETALFYLNAWTPRTVIFTLFIAFFISQLIEHTLFIRYKKEAKEKLERINPTIIAITASYGKTSIKNYLFQLIEADFKTYKTPRSVNTLKGIVLDINRDMPEDTEVYIVEAGAREKGDIAEIATFLDHQYAILGKIGPQHIEYFKTLENIQKTKEEIQHSRRLKETISYAPTTHGDAYTIEDKLSEVKENLEGIDFTLNLEKKMTFHAPILGGFNALNLSLCIVTAERLGLSLQMLKTKTAKLESVAHRLQKIEAGGKVIIDDSFNGNIDGMLSSMELVSHYEGRKVIVTPGLVEASEEMNTKVARKIDEIFDLVIITGELNRETLCKNIEKPDKIVLQNKEALEKTLSENTGYGDLILFSNDAPSFI